MMGKKVALIFFFYLEGTKNLGHSAITFDSKGLLESNIIIEI